MISLMVGNLLDASVDALVNPVNTAGVMGKGLALAFRNAFPENYALYRQACKDNAFQLGEVLVIPVQQTYPRYIINFPTKQHWRNASRLEDIQSGLVALVQAVRMHAIQSIAVPALGCGLGNLDWAEVFPAIEAAFSELPGVDVWVYPPQ